MIPIPRKIRTIASKTSAQVAAMDRYEPAMFRQSLCQNFAARSPSAEHVCFLTKVTVDDR